MNDPAPAILFAYPHPQLVGGTERAMHLAAAALGRQGWRVGLVHAGEATEASNRWASGYADVFAAPEWFDNRIAAPAKLRERFSDLTNRLREHGYAAVHAHAHPRVGVLTGLKRADFRTVSSVHVAHCPNGSRYLWDKQAVCTRRPGVACVTGGYLRDGCGRLADGSRWPIAGFMRNVIDDRRKRRELQGCDAVVPTSRWIADRLRADGYASANLTVVHPPLDETTETVESAAEPRNNPPAVLFVGRLAAFKGVDHLLRAAAAVRADGDRAFRVWVVGDGPAGEDLRRLTDELRLNDVVTFFGSLPPAEIEPLRRRATLAAVPSLWPEAFGMVGPEAMRQGLPVVAYDAGGIGEWLSDGETGFLVPHGDVTVLAAGLRRLLRDNALTRRFGEAARSVASRWSADDHAAALIRVYESLPDPRPAAAENLAPAGVTEATR